ncbi:MAG: O-antigen ligase family protein [Clostridiales bacterium]|nr:O-antigen ligase family protein [Clostridiales bacterium]
MSSFNPITILRPLIPIVILTIIFFKVSLAEKIQVLFLGILNIGYIFVHSIVFLEYKTHFGSRVLIDEVRIVMNYIFAIINIYIMFKLFFRRNTDKLKISIAIMTGIYILSICIPMILNISPSTYQEGIGQKGFFETGNSLSIILLLAVGLLLTTIKLKGRYIYLAITVFTSLYLLFIMGSRTGFYRSNITYDSIYFSKYIFIYNE